jgi:hypothetical protein
MADLTELLKRYQALPPTAIVQAKVAAAVLGLSERSIRYREDLPRRKVGPRRYGFRKSDIDALCEGGAS